MNRATEDSSSPSLNSYILASLVILAIGLTALIPLFEAMPQLGYRTADDSLSSHNVASSENGASASIKDPTGVTPEAAIDGNVTDYGPTNGAAFVPLGKPLTIQFAKPTRIGVIRVLLYDKDDRYYRYFVEVSTLGGAWKRVADRTQGEWRSWQFINFDPVVTRELRILGTYGSVSPWLHVVELEAYDDRFKNRVSSEMKGQ